MMATERAQLAAGADTTAILREVQRQFVRIHYPLAEAITVDVDLQRRTLERLMNLMEYVENAINAPTNTQ